MKNNPLDNTNIKLKNTKLLVALSLILVFIGGLLPVAVEAVEASLFFSPSSGNYQVGDTFSVKVKVNSDGVPINAAQAKIFFPQNILEVKNISKAGSIFTLWPEEPIFSNSNGEIGFKGGVPAPGFTGEGNILTINFQARKIGEAKVSFSEAEVLAADGRGTNILKIAQEATFSITEIPLEIVKVPASPKISSPTHPKENFWYSNPNPEFQWEISSDIIGINYGLDENPFSIPEVISKKVESSKSFEGIKDGIWYFHLRVQNKIGWSNTSHYKIQTDTAPPHSFDVIVDNQGDPTNPRPFLYFETEDDLSGISHYEIRIGEGDIFSLVIAETNPLHLPHQAPGSYDILVKAIDKAGNSEKSSALLDVESIPIPEISVYPKTYIAGGEVFYVAGTVPADLTVIIFFEKEGKLIKTWETKSDKDGDWSFSTSELFKSGNYLISARSRDQRGAISHSSPRYQVKVILAGISIGPLIITYQTLFLILMILILLITVIVVYLISSKTKKLRKETQEAAQSLKDTFNNLREETIKRIEYLDSKPGLNPEEEKLRDELIDILEKSEEEVAKEIEDIKKELR